MKLKVPRPNGRSKLKSVLKKRSSTAATIKAMTAGFRPLKISSTIVSYLNFFKYLVMMQITMMLGVTMLKVVTSDPITPARL